MSGRFLRAAAAACAACLFALGGPSGATESKVPRDGIHSFSPRALQRLAPIVRTELGARIVTSIAAADAAGEESLTLVEPFHDLSGDDRADLLVVTYRWQEFLEGPIDSEIAVHRGTDGRRIFRKRFELESGIAFPLEARVGKRARRGMIVLTYEGIQGPIEEWEMSATAIARTGRAVWRHSWRTRIVQYQGFGVAYENVPVTIETFDGLPGRQTDVLLGLAEIVAGPAYSHAHVIDGSNGKVSDHPGQEIGLTQIPFPAAARHQDDDRLDDYIFINSRPYVRTNEQAPDPVGIGGTLTARRGKDGEEIWHHYGIELGDAVWPWSAPDMRGSAHNEFLLSTAFAERDWTKGEDWDTYLIAGGSGRTYWRRLGTWPYVAGDIDTRPGADTITRSFAYGDGQVVSRLWATGANGKKIWARNFATRTEEPTGGVGGSWVGTGWVPVGDFQNDGVVDTEIFHDMGADPGGRRFVRYTIDGATGRKLVQGGRELTPAAAALDGRGSDLLLVEPGRAGEISVRAKDALGPRTLWDVTLDADLTLDEDTYFPFATGARFSPDGANDVALALGKSFGTDVVFMLDGRNGEVLWRLDV